jgi:hypothetical protein
MNLRHERAGGVQHIEPALLRIALDALRHTVRAEDRDRAVRHFIQFFDETRAFTAQIFDDVPVMHDFVAYVHGGAVPLQCAIHYFDRANDARTKAAGLSKDDSHVWRTPTESGYRAAGASAVVIALIPNLLLESGRDSRQTNPNAHSNAIGTRTLPARHRGVARLSGRRLRARAAMPPTFAASR